MSLPSTLSFEQLEASAAKGRPESQHALGWRYEHGEGIAQDYKLAEHWYRKAAEAGNAGGQNQLGGLYERGFAVEQDFALALHWFRAAAEQGAPDAMANLGRLYAQGKGVDQDFTQAAHWYRSAAELGHTGAQNNLSNMYLLGEGVPRDNAEGAKWKMRAAEGGFSMAQSALASLYLSGVGVEKDFIQAGHWYKRASENGAEDATKYLESTLAICVKAPSTDPDKEKCCLVSAGAGYAEGQFAVATYYHSGHSWKQDHQQAAEWYRKAAEQGHPLAQAMIGTLLSKGEGLPRNDSEAYAWFSVLANHAATNEDEKFAVKGAKVMQKLLFDRMTAEQREHAISKAEEHNEIYRGEK